MPKTKDELKQILKDLEKAIDEKKGKPSKQLQDNIKRFLKDCNDHSERDWKTNAMSLGESIIAEQFERWEELEEEPDLKQELDLHLRWIIPVPPDPEVIAQVIARDRGREAVEKAKKNLEK